MPDGYEKIDSYQKKQLAAADLGNRYLERITRVQENQTVAVVVDIT